MNYENKRKIIVPIPNMSLRDKYPQYSVTTSRVKMNLVFILNPVDLKCIKYFVIIVNCC